MCFNGAESLEESFLLEDGDEAAPFGPTHSIPHTYIHILYMQAMQRAMTMLLHATNRFVLCCVVLYVCIYAFIYSITIYMYVCTVLLYICMYLQYYYIHIYVCTVLLFVCMYVQYYIRMYSNGYKKSSM
jgi:hypothetical protein